MGQSPKQERSLSADQEKTKNPQMFTLARNGANVLPALSQFNLHTALLRGITFITFILQLEKQDLSFFISNNPRLWRYCVDQAG